MHLLKALIFFSGVALASTDAVMPTTLDLNLRYRAASNHLNTVDAGGYVRTPLWDFLDASAGARVLFTRRDVDGFEYGGEIGFPFLSLFRISTRLSYLHLLPEPLSITSVLFAFHLKLQPVSWFTFFASTGWYRRFVHLNKLTILPTFRSSYSDHDFGGAVGFEFGTYPMSLRAQVATFEELTIYNLHNPFAEVRLSYPFSTFVGQIFARYQILLGFGRLDEFMAGTSVRLTF